MTDRTYSVTKHIKNHVRVRHGDQFTGMYAVLNGNNRVATTCTV